MWIVGEAGGGGGNQINQHFRANPSPWINSIINSRDKMYILYY